MFGKRSVRRWVPAARALAAAGIMAALLGACAGQAPVRQADGSLASCDDVSNCVSSQAQDDGHRIEPLRYTGSGEQARHRLLAILTALPRVRIVVNVPNYIHAEVKSQVMGRLDDVEFLFSAHEPRVDMRAASRGGSLGPDGNRERLEAIRASFEKGG